VGSRLLSSIMCMFSKKVLIYFPLLSVVIDSHLMLRLLKSRIFIIKCLGICFIIFPMSIFVNAYWLGKSMLHILNSRSLNLTEVATTSNSEVMLIFLLKYSVYTYIAAPPLARKQSILFM